MNDERSSDFADDESVVDASNEQLDAALSSAAGSLAEAESVIEGTAVAGGPWSAVDSDLEVDVAAEASPWGSIAEGVAVSEPVAPAAVEAAALADTESAEAALALNGAGGVPQPIAPIVAPAPEAVAPQTEFIAAAETVAPDAVAETTAVAWGNAAPAVVEETAVYAPQPSAAAINPIFVQAPEAPRPRGNRAFSGLVGLVATAAFAVIYGVAAVVVQLVWGDIEIDGLQSAALEVLSSATFWVPVITFFLAFWLLGAIINRGGWAYWVIFGLLIGVVSYGGHILGVLWSAPFWLITPSAALELIRLELLAPLAIVAFVAARELTIWFGAWVASRARKLTALNLEDQLEYERQLEAGPQLP